MLNSKISILEFNFFNVDPPPSRQFVISGILLFSQNPKIGSDWPQTVTTFYS